MRARKVVVLLLLLAFGGFLEVAWTVRGELHLGATGCRILGGRFYGPSYAFETEGRVASPEGALVEVTNAFGAVEVWAGAPGEVRTRLRTVVFLPTEDAARSFSRRVRTVAAADADTVRVSTNRKELDERDVGLETHLSVAVPPGTVVRVRNEHGRVDVRDVASADLESSYDSVTVDRVAGDARASNRHGSIAASSVGGALSLSNRHGDVEAKDVGGRTALEVSHGDVAVSRSAALSVQVSYGDLVAEEVRGDLEVEGRHAAVRAADVAGRARIATDYRDVQVTRVSGDAELAAQHGEVAASEIQGAVTARASFNDVVLSSIGGPVDVKVEHGGVRGRNLRRGARVEAAGDDVVLEGFQGAVVVENRRGGAELVPEAPLTDPLQVSCVHGAIRLEVPGGSRFDLVASARPGEVRVDLPELSITESSPDRVSGRVGGGGPRVILAADHGDVSVESHDSMASRER
ncbi:MAG: hypothetical protein HY317_05455 [Acidobacteria bacterium]|nr:hypothetical protein [Acidobacteriota bacterium]